MSLEHKLAVSYYYFQTNLVMQVKNCGLETIPGLTISVENDSGKVMSKVDLDSIEPVSCVSVELVGICEEESVVYKIINSDSGHVILTDELSNPSIVMEPVWTDNNLKLTFINQNPAGRPMNNSRIQISNGDNIYHAILNPDYTQSEMVVNIDNFEWTNDTANCLVRFEDFSHYKIFYLINRD